MAEDTAFEALSKSFQRRLKRAQDRGYQTSEVENEIRLLARIEKDCAKSVTASKGPKIEMVPRGKRIITFDEEA